MKNFWCLRIKCTLMKYVKGKATDDDGMWVASHQVSRPGRGGSMPQGGRDPAIRRRYATLGMEGGGGRGRDPPSTIQGQFDQGGRTPWLTQGRSPLNFQEGWGVVTPGARRRSCLATSGRVYEVHGCPSCASATAHTDKQSIALGGPVSWGPTTHDDGAEDMGHPPPLGL